MKTNDRPMAHPEVVLREEFDDWAVLFNPDTADAVGINPVGVALWKNLNGKRTVAELAGVLDGLFDAVPDSAQSEVAAFVEDLAKRGFVGFELT